MAIRDEWGTLEERLEQATAVARTMAEGGNQCAFAIQALLEQARDSYRVIFSEQAGNAEAVTSGQA